MKKSSAMSPWLLSVLGKLVDKRRDEIAASFRRFDRYDIEDLLLSKPAASDADVVASMKRLFAENFNWSGLVSSEWRLFGEEFNRAVNKALFSVSNDEPDVSARDHVIEVRTKFYGAQVEPEVELPSAYDLRPEKEIDEAARKLGARSPVGGYTTTRWTFEKDYYSDMLNVVFEFWGAWIIVPEQAALVIEQLFDRELFGREFEEKVLRLLAEAREEIAAR